MNGATFESPDVPTLLQIISGFPVLLPTGSTYRLPRNKVIELTIPTGAQGGEVSWQSSNKFFEADSSISFLASRPFTRRTFFCQISLFIQSSLSDRQIQHSFSVVRSGGSDSYNYVNPVRRDVVSMGPQDSNSNVTIRFTTDNPGPWIFHWYVV